MNVNVPTPIRVVAYLVGIFGTPTVTWLAAEHRIDTLTAVFLTAVVAGVAGTLALSHLSLPDVGPGSSAAPDAPAGVDPTKSGPDAVTVAVHGEAVQALKVAKKAASAPRSRSSRTVK